MILYNGVKCLFLLQNPFSRYGKRIFFEKWFVP